MLLDDAGEIFHHSGRTALGRTRAECELKTLALLKALAREAPRKDLAFGKTHRLDWSLKSESPAQSGAS
jgi:hypothetical protein